MSRKRIFFMVNILLIALSIGLGYYLVTSVKTPPRKIATATDLVKILQGEGYEDVIVLPQEERVLVPVGLLPPRQIMEAIYTQTPEPTRTPQPTPTPLPLDSMINSWLITGMQESAVTILDQRNGQEFDIQLNGEPAKVELQGQTIAVTLCGVDLNELKATFCAGSQTTEKAF